MLRRLRLYIHGISAPAEERAEQNVQEETINLLRQIMSKLDELKLVVAAVRDAEAAASTLLVGISQRLKDALANPATTGISDEDAQGIISDLDTGRAALAAAVVANTPPAAPEPGPVAAAVEPGQPEVAADPNNPATGPSPSA